MGFFDDIANFLHDVRQVGEQLDDVKQELLAPVTELTDSLSDALTEATETPEAQDATDEG